MNRVDVLIAGGGTAGLAAAVALGSLGLRVLCVDPAPAGQADGGPDRDADLRTTAVLAPGQALLDRAGVWARLEEEPTALRVMRVVDAAGAAPVARDFDSGDLGEAPFGWNVPNRVLGRALAARLADLPDVELRQGARFANRLARADAALVTLADGTRIEARLLLGADGRASAVRRAAGIDVLTHRTGQAALVFAVTHDAPHHGVSTEVHRADGPFTLVPLPDHDGRPCSSVVWMMDGPEAQRLRGLDPDAFAQAVNDRSAGVMGALAPVGPPQAWPIVTQVARAMTARRTALMAEAAHVLPPIGAQGFNTSLADVAALESLARDRPDGLGDDPWLAAYAREREGDVRLRALGVGALNLASIAGLGPVRAWGLRAAHDVGPLRHALMRLGLGAA